MSWEAVSWANKQSMKLPQEQLVLLVLANCADPDGVAFAQWRGRDHWWHYLAKRTRLSKASLFRHLHRLEELELGVRSIIILADGTKRPTFALDLTKSFDIDDIEENQSHSETEDDTEYGEGESLNDINQSQGETQAPASRSHSETSKSGPQSHSETNSVSLVRPHIDSNVYSKSNPPTPPAGGPVVRDELWEEFVRRSWRDPIPKMALARSAWDHVATDRRGEAIAAAKGYFAWLAKQAKPPATISAQSFLRDAPSWPQWLRYTPDGDGIVKTVGLYPLDGAEAKALGVLYDVAGHRQFFFDVKRKPVGVYHADPITPQLLALAQAGSRETWPKLTYQQAAAWEGFLRGHLSINRRRLAEGEAAPWPWPPRKDGAVATGPPTDQQMLSEQDENDARGGLIR